MAREVRIAILGDSRDFSRAVQKANRDAGMLDGKLGSVSRGIGRFGRVAALGLAGVAAGAGVMAKGFVDAAIESRKVTKQTEAVLKSMGKVAGVTAQDVAKLSETLSMQTGIDDELIQSGQNLLLTFGKVRNEVGKGNDVFDQATRLALDMSVALGSDMKGAALQVGKALNDPVKGVTALTRAGVSFTQKQKDTIKRLVETGDTLGAQKLILSELDKQFSGSAKAQATAGERLKVVWGNIQERLGEKLLPILEKVATFLANNLPAAMAAVGRVAGPLARNVGAFFKALFSGFTEDEGTGVERAALRLRKILLGMGEAARKWWADHGPKIIAVAKLIREAFERIATGVRNTVEFISRNWGTIFPILKATAVLIATVLIPHWVALKVEAGLAAAKTAAAWVMTQAAAIKAAVVHSAQVVIMVAKWAWMGVQALAHAAKVAAAWLIAMGPIAIVAAAVVGLTYVVVRNWDTIKKTITGAATAVLNFLKSNWPTILAIITGPIGLAVLAISRNWESIKAGVGAAWSWIVARISDGVAAVRTVIGRLVGIGDRITAPFVTAFRYLAQLWDWIVEKVRWAVGKVKGLVDSILGPIDEVAGAVGGVVGAVGGGVGSVFGGLFHQGGIVPGTPGADVPIIAQAGEGVFTRGQMAAIGAFAGSGRGSTTINNHIYMPPGSDGQDVVEAIRRYERRNGTGWRN